MSIANLQPVICAEVLTATILLWVSVFGLCEEVLKMVQSASSRILFYFVLGVGVLVFVFFQKGVTSCSLM